MKKTFLLGMVMVLAFGLIYAWADQPNITKNHQKTDISVGQQATPNANSTSRPLTRGEVPVVFTEKTDLKAEAKEVAQPEMREEVKTPVNVKRSQVQRPMTASVVFSDDFEDGDYTANPAWTETHNPAGHPWAIQTDPWVPQSYDNISNNGSGWLVGVDDDAGGSAMNTACTLSTTYEGTGLVNLNLFYYLYTHASGTYFEVRIDGVTVDFVNTSTNGDRQVNISAYNAVGSHTLQMIWEDGTSWGYAQAFDDVLITDDPPATGACCFGDPGDPSCLDMLEDDCIVLVDFIEWTYGTECATYECPVVNPGDNCLNPIDITLPYTETGGTNCNGEDYDATCLGYYDSGDDIIYEFTITEETDVWVVLDPHGTTYSGVGLAAECPPTTCLGLSTNSGSGAHGFNVLLAAGTYYIMIDTWAAPQCIPNYDLYVGPPPTGRCCYYDEDPPDLYNPLCASPVTEAECTALIGGFSGSWDYGLNCNDDPCPTIPPNDNCADAIAVGEGVYYENTVYATTDGIGTHTINKDVWYCYTPAGDGEATVALCASDYDTKLAIWEGCTCPPTVELAYEDDGCYGRAPQSDLTISVTGGQTYLIQAGSWSTTYGNLVVDITLVQDPPGRCCYGDIYAPDCIVNTESECTALSGYSWLVNEDCDSAPCEPACPADSLILVITTDSWPDETTWEVVDHDDPGIVYASGGPYDMTFTTYREKVCMAIDQCVDVLIYDAYGDGGPDYEIWLNEDLLFSGTLTGYGLAFGNIGNGCEVILGACCDDLTGICADDVAEANCAEGSRWVQETLCADIYPPCGVPLGACCYEIDGLPACDQNTETECTALEGTWTEGGACEDCGACVGATYDNGAPLDDYGSPASQVFADLPGVYLASSVDDFTIPGTGFFQVDFITAFTTHWNGAQGLGPNLYQAVEVAIYADYHFGTPDTAWPGGYLESDGVTYTELTTDGVVYHETITDFTFWPVTRPCTGDLWQVNLRLADLTLLANTKYWISVMPVMPFGGGGQCAFAISSLNTGDPTQRYFFGLGINPYAEFAGNGGNCDPDNYPAGTMKDLAFCIHGQYAGSIAGTVTEAGVGPIEGVLVEALGSGVSDLTNASGVYNLEGVMPGTYDVSFTHVDYNDTTHPGVVVTGGDVTILNMQMTRAAYAYLVGDANMRIESVPKLLGADVTYLVNYFIISSGTPGCKIDYGGGEFYMAADVNGTCTVLGADVTRLVSVLSGAEGAVLEHCADYTPMWYNNIEAPTDPGDLPPGWPPCVPLPPAAATELPTVSE